MLGIPPSVFEKLQSVEEPLRRFLSRIDKVPAESVVLPKRLDHRLRLLNLQVWALRYRVDLPFVLDTLLLRTYGRMRHVSGASGQGRLGIPVATLCGRAAEQALQETLIRLPYRPQQERLAPIMNLNYSTTSNMVAEYGAAILARRKAIEARQAACQLSPRAWRGRRA